VALLLKVKAKPAAGLTIPTQIVDPKGATPGDIQTLINLVGNGQASIEKIKKQIKALNEQLKQYTDDEKLLVARLSEDERWGDDESLVQQGDGWLVEAGPRGSQRSVTDMKKIREMLGDEVFMQCVTITLKDLDAYLTLEQRKKVTKTDRTARSIKVLKKAADKKAA
jgi:hypothetical protein